MEHIYQKIKTELQPYNFLSNFDHEKKLISVENVRTKRRLEIDLNKFKWRANDDITELKYYIINALQVVPPSTIADQAEAILPVIRAKSFPITNNAGTEFIRKEHTVETTIYYALDRETTYHLITTDMLATANFAPQSLHECALKNLKKAPLKYKKEIVANNEFYFIHLNDGYDAARILIIDEIVSTLVKDNINGKLFLAIPHHDILIIGRLFNQSGIAMLGHITMDYFVNGKLPITNLVFAYENEQLAPHFILPKTKIK